MGQHERDRAALASKAYRERKRQARTAVDNRTCAYCGNSLKGKIASAKVCSDVCRVMLWRAEATDAVTENRHGAVTGNRHVELTDEAGNHYRCNSLDCPDRAVAVVQYGYGDYLRCRVHAAGPRVNNATAILEGDAARAWLADRLRDE